MRLVSGQCLDAGGSSRRHKKNRGVAAPVISHGIVLGPRISGIIVESVNDPKSSGYFLVDCIQPGAEIRAVRPIPSMDSGARGS